MKNTPVAARPAAHSGDGGLTIVTSSPFRRRTDQERSVTVPPTVSRTTSTSRTTVSNGVVPWSTTSSTPSLRHEVTVAGGGSPDDVGAAPAGELDGEAANPASSAVDQDPLPKREPGVVGEGLPGRQGGKGDRRGARVIEAAGFRGEVGGGYGHVFGGPSVP